MKFVPPRRTVQRPGVVFILNAQQKPEARKVVVGITDGSATEVVSGDLHAGDRVIIGDSTQLAKSPAPANPGFAFGFGRGGGGGRGQ